MRKTLASAFLPCTMAFALLAIFIGGCAQPIEVSSEYGPGVRFAETAHRYAWAPGADRSTGEGRPENADADKLIRQFMEAHLARKGYQKSTGAGADFLIDYRVSKSNRADPNDFTKPLYKEGTLEIVAVNPANSQTIWKGTGQTKLDPSTSPEASRELLDTVIGKMIDQIPTAKAN